MEKQSADVLLDFEKINVTYATFGQRLSACLIDLLVFAPLIVLDWANNTKWKSMALMIIIALVSMLYKPFCEFMYGRTIGKMSMKILVVNTEFNKIALSQAILRNIFDLSERIYSLVTSIMVFRMLEFKYTDSINDYTTLNDNIQYSNYITIVTTAILIVEVICVLRDKQRRSLHDRIAHTLVIKRQ